MALTAPEIPDGELLIYPPSGSGGGVILVLAGDPSITPTVGGWQDSQRFGRLPATWWSGPEQSGTIELQVAADSRLTPKYPDVTGTVVSLQKLGQPNDGTAQPPVVQVICTATPTLDKLDLVIQGLSLGAQVLTGGVLVRQEMTVSLQTYQPFSPLTSVNPKATRTSSNTRRARVISARQGDTLRSIAVRQLGDATRWKDIRSWNKPLAKVDPDAPLKAGTKVTLR